MRKESAFPDTNLDDLYVSPESSRQEVGYQLNRIQQRLNPYDRKSLSTIGPGVREIRTRDTDGTYRAVYIAKLEEAVYVLYCLQEKTQTTSQSDTGLVKQHYKELVQGWKDEN